MSERIDSLRARLAARAPELQPIAENVLAEVRRVDLVAIDGQGVAYTILEAQPGEDAAMLTHAVAATAWLTARLSDWAQLAPDAGIDAATPARALVVGRSFHPDTIAVAALLGDDCVRLLTLPAPTATPTGAQSDAAPIAASEPRASLPTPRPAAAGAGSAAAPAPSAPAANPGESPDAQRSRFRTGLAAADLGFARA